MSLFISNAYAAAPGGAQGDTFGMLIMFGVMGLFFYFILYRPQAKRMKEHKSMVEALGKGDEVLTQGGLVGRINKISADKDFMEISLNDSTNIVVQKSAVTAVLPKGTMKNI